VELSPLAREKLAKIGELTEEEREHIKYARQLADLLAKYFKGDLNPDGLWKELQEHKKAGREFMLKDAQTILLEATNLSSNDVDFEKMGRGILAAETLKEAGDYSAVDHELKSLENLRRKYREEKDKAYSRIKADVEKQVRAAAQQLAGQAASKGAAIDVQGSVEATAKASPEWKSFITRHENTYNQKFKEVTLGLRERLKK